MLEILQIANQETRKNHLSARSFTEIDDYTIKLKFSALIAVYTVY